MADEDLVEGKRLPAARTSGRRGSLGVTLLALEEALASVE